MHFNILTHYSPLASCHIILPNWPTFCFHVLVYMST